MHLAMTPPAQPGAIFRGVLAALGDADTVMADNERVTVPPVWLLLAASLATLRWIGLEPGPGLSVPGPASATALESGLFQLLWMVWRVFSNSRLARMVSLVRRTAAIGTQCPRSSILTRNRAAI